MTRHISKIRLRLHQPPGLYLTSFETSFPPQGAVEVALQAVEAIMGGMSVSNYNYNYLKKTSNGQGPTSNSTS